jgi:membrane-bound lytic murein transglycosylase A
VEDPLDALILQIQGSGRLQITEPDGRQRLVRLAFAGHNDQPYKSVGRWLIDQGELKPGEASWPGIRTGRGATPSACRSCCGRTRATSSSARNPCPTPAWGPRARRPCR